MLDFQKNLALLLAIAAIFSGLLSPVLDPNFAAGTAGGGAGDTSGDDTSGDDTSGDDTSGDDTSGDGTDNELQPDPDPCVEDPTLEGCEDPCVEDPTLEGCEPPDDCDPSYPDICVQSPPPDLNCDDVSHSSFKVVGSDPHGFDGDNDGIGCEDGGNGNGGNNGRDCDPSYPDNCIRSPPPKLNCDNISFRNFRVIGNDPHGFDGDNDSIGCEGTGGSAGSGDGSNSDGSSSSANDCQGQADCFRGTVTEIVDGDTIDISTIRVRLALVNTPEIGESGYSEAREFVNSVCGIGTSALVDEDDRQREGSFDRLIGVIYCGDSGINNKKSLNELLLGGGYAVIDQDFCNTSEFSSSSWVQRYGC